MSSEAAACAASFGCPYIECSAETGERVDTAVYRLVRDVMASLIADEIAQDARREAGRNDVAFAGWNMTELQRVASGGAQNCAVM